MILLGNLTTQQIEARLGIEFPQETRDFMDQTHQASAGDVASGKWHCFDIPFNLVCGDVETATTIYNALKPMASQCKEPLQFSVQG